MAVRKIPVIAGLSKPVMRQVVGLELLADRGLFGYATAETSQRTQRGI